MVAEIAKTIPEGISPEDSYQQKAGILAEFGKTACISIGCFQIRDNENFLKIKSIYGHDEKELLQAFLTINNKMRELKMTFSLPVIISGNLISLISAGE